MSGLHQFVPMLHRGDAVGRHTMRLRELIVARGIDSRIYVELTDPETAAETTLAARYPTQCRPGDVLLYQFATASDLAPWLVDRGETLVVNYHNVTPPELFAAWDNRLALHQVRARSELHLMAPRAALGIAVSAFNRSELDAAGFSTTAVVPPAAVLMGGGRPEVPARSPGRPGHGGRWLSVGRLAPNKAIEDVLTALLVTRSSFDPQATLEIVGKPVVASYTTALHRFVAESGLEGAVTFRGHAPDADLAAAYARADVLVVTSEHEGFGVPAIEAMSVGLPVVVSARGALPEVVGAGGVVVDTKDPWAVAATIADLLRAAPRRAALAAAARTQLARLDLATAGDRLVDVVVALR